MRQESHRIYWQQWDVVTDPDIASERKLITGSAAIRISDAARAADVTALLRQTLDLGDSSDDALVLVGTLHSLPAHYIQFEHELNESPESEPVHVVRTLQMEENPLEVRDRLLAHLKRRQKGSQTPTQRTVIAPRLQWFFVPTSSQAPNCIDLDGYSTSLEEEQDEDDSDEEGECHDDEYDTVEDALVQYPWLHPQTTEFPLQQPNKEPSSESPSVQWIAREERRLHQLAHCQSALDLHTVSGYLYKRSSHDRHVWRRVHCVLSDDYVWFVSRLYDVEQQSVAKHQRVSLTRALLLESSTSDYAPLQRIPHSFELVSSSGKSHVLRAANRKLFLRWIQCLGDRIVQCHENRQLEHAELIVEDEALARNRRLSSLATEPLGIKYASSPPECDSVYAVLRWGMDVADYREHCRHIQGRMPTKKVVVSDGVNPTPRKLFGSPPPTANGKHSPSKGEKDSSSQDGLSKEARDMIRSAWDAAAELLTRAKELAKGAHKKDNGGNDECSMPRNLESLCHHIDYVITGRVRPLSDGVGESSSPHGRQDRCLDPPPMDLFDKLLAELQSRAGPNSVGKRNGVGKS